MPTYNRREFVPQAIAYFLRQDYERKELLIVDDGTVSVADLIPDHNQIRYIRLSGSRTLGAKRNYCVAESKGDLILHWDDDDWMAANRISYQVRELLTHKAEVCGLQQMLFYELKTGKGWLYKYPNNWQAWLAGGSLLYTREFWKKKPFPDIQVASDTHFIWSRKLESYVALSDFHFYVACIHENNTSPKRTNSKIWQPLADEKIFGIVSDDFPFYLQFKKGVKVTVPVPVEKVHLPGNGKIILEPKKSIKPLKHPVSACLLSYKRPHNLQHIVNSIHHFPFIDEILVWNNNPEYKLELTGDKVRIFNSDENALCHGRFLCVREAKNEIIFVQDDDVIVSNVPQLYNEFLANDSCITHALYLNHYQQRNKSIYPSGQEALLGWGSFFKKSWTLVLDDYLSKNKNDYLFRREADKFFSLLMKKNHNTIPAQIKMLDGHSTPGIALYREKEHRLFKALAIRKALEFNRKSHKIKYPVSWNVVIPCMNYGKYLEEAVNSVLYSHADYVITIVDDFSTDNTFEVSKKLVEKYPFIHYLKNEQNCGVSFARNRGIASVDSVFVVLLDADDKIGAEYLFEAEKLLRQGYDVVNPDAILFGDYSSRWSVPETVSLPSLFNKNHVHSAAAFRRSYWAQVGGIDEKMHNWQDYEYWIRLAAAGARIKKLPGNHYYYRKHGVSKSSESSKNREMLQAYIRSKHQELFDPQADKIHHTTGISSANSIVGSK